jgi:hypothetical protein
LLGLILPVAVDAGTNADVLHAIEEAFRDAGLPADVQPSIIELSQASTWIVLINIPPTAFLTAYATAAGADAWGATKRSFTRLRQLVHDLKIANGGGADGRISLEEGGRPWLLLTSNLPDEAYVQLEDVDMTAAQGGALEWDENRQEWMHVEQGKTPHPAPKLHAD